MMKQIESRRMSEEEILKARVEESESALKALRKKKREYLMSSASDAALELIRTYLSAGQQDALRKMDSETHEAELAMYALKQELAGRFPPPMPQEPPKWEIDPVAEAARTGKTIGECKALKALVNHTPANAGFNADRTLQRRWAVDGVEVKDLNDPREAHDIPAIPREPKKVY